MSSLLIWDLDGTIVDSYRVIVGAVRGLAEEYGIKTGEADVRAAVLKTSVTDYLHSLAKNSAVGFQEVKKRYSAISRDEDSSIELMPYAYETFCTLQKMDVINCIFTHRGESTVRLLKRLQIDRFFREVLTSRSGFPRKPDPEAIRYLMGKCGGDPATTYYIGDRDIDARCAKNAGIHSVLLESSYVSEKADYRIVDLRKICALPHLREKVMEK